MTLLVLGSVLFPLLHFAAYRKSYTEKKKIGESAARIGEIPELRVISYHGGLKKHRLAGSLYFLPGLVKFLTAVGYKPIPVGNKPIRGRKISSKKEKNLPRIALFPTGVGYIPIPQ